MGGRTILNLNKLVKPSFLLLFLGCLATAFILLTLIYSLRSEHRISVGELGDAPYIAGFNNDEPGAPRYRWTGRARLPENEPAVAFVDFPLSLASGNANRLKINVRAAASAPTVQILVNGVPAGEAKSEANTWKTLEFTLPTTVPAQDSTRVEIRSATFQPPADSRRLGVQIADVILQTAPTLRLPPLDAIFWAAVLLLSVTLINFKLAGLGLPRFALFILHPLSFILLALALVVPRNLNLWYTPFYLNWLGVAAGLLALVLWWKTVSAGLSAALARLESSPVLARNLLFGFIGLYTLLAFVIILQMDWIGHADYADNAVAARNIVQGRGYSLDYAAQFYEKYTLPRAADTWPPLQPFMTVPFFAVFGPQVWAAKLPNLILASVLAWVIFVYGAKLFNRRTAFFAAVLTLLAVVPAFSDAPAFFFSIAYPVNDLGFTLFAFLAVVTLYLAATDQSKFLQIPPSFDEGEIPPAKPVSRLKLPLPQWAQESKLWLLAGLWSGLLFLCKPSGGLLLAVVGVWILALKFWGRNRSALSWKSLFICLGVAGLVVAPYILRNLWHFGTPLASTERYDAWLTKWFPPDERIYDLFTPFSDRPLPNPRQLLEYGWDAMLRGIDRQFDKFFEDVTQAELFQPLILLLTAVGLAVVPRRNVSLAWLLGAILVVYILFFNIFWHYEPRYFLMWLPWLNLFGLFGLFWIYDKMVMSSEAAPERPGRQAAGIALTLTALGLLLVPNLTALAETAPKFTTPTGIVTTANWIKENTPPDAVIMSRNVWQLSFHSERHSVMVPNNATLAQIKDVMRIYNVRYLQLDHLEPDDRNVNRQWGQRSALWGLLDRKPEPGFTLIYDKGGLLVYRWEG
jgi:4-amino-4-deoxy-L-arabinose transferase-like glycosyltransferase